jgi:hypothetical protein
VVEEVHPRHDGLVQVATIKTKMSGASCNDQDDDGKHKTPHSQTSVSSHRKINSKGHTC